MALVQWHTQPYEFPETTVEEIKLNAPYNKASSALQQRLDEFVTFLTDRGFQPRETFTELCYRYRRIYGEYPKYLGPIAVFVRVATIDELQEQVRAGWTWNRTTVEPIGRDCLGHPAFTWAPYRTNHLLPKRDPSHNYGITDLNRIIYQTMTTVSSTYSCCGKELNHPGCWMGPKKYERVLYDVAPSFSSGRMWDLIVSDQWDQVEALWRYEPPRRGTIWLYKEFYDDLHAKITEAKPRVTAEIVRVLRACREEKLEKDDPASIPLNPWGKFDLDALYTLRQILEWQTAYNKIQCTGYPYDLFALSVGESLLNSEENHNVYRGVKLLKVSPAHLTEALDDAKRVRQELGTDALDQYIEGIEVIRAFDMQKILMLASKIDELDGFLVDELNVDQVAQAIADYRELKDIGNYGRDFRRAFNRNPEAPELSFQPELGRIRRIDGEIALVRSNIETENLNQIAEFLLRAKNTPYEERLLEDGDDREEEILKEYHAGLLDLQKEAERYTQKLYAEFVQAKRALKGRMDHFFHLLLVYYEMGNPEAVNDTFGPLEKEWQNVKAILDPQQIDLQKRLQTTTWENADFSQAPQRVKDAREMVLASERYPSLDPAERESFKRLILGALVLNKAIPDNVYQQFALTVNRYKAEEVSEQSTWKDAERIPIPDSGVLPEARKIIGNALKSSDATIGAYAKDLQKLFVFVATLGDTARQSDLNSLQKAAADLLQQMQRLPVVLETRMVPKDIVPLDNQVKIDRSPVLSTSALVWGRSSCWIDAPMTALFSIPETSLEQLMRNRQQIYVPESCDHSQGFYNAIMTDIAYLQSHDIRGSPQMCQSMQFHGDCVRERANIGAYNFHNLIINNLKDAFQLGPYISYINGNSRTELLVKDYPLEIFVEGELRQVPDTLENGTFTLFSVIRYQEGENVAKHFVAGIREPTDPDIWWHVDKETRTRTNLRNLASDTMPKYERLAMAFYMRTTNWDRIAAKARSAHPILNAVQIKSEVKVEEVLDQQPASILADLERLNLLSLKNPSEWLLQAVRAKKEEDVQVILDASEDILDEGNGDDLRKIGLFE